MKRRDRSKANKRKDVLALLNIVAAALAAVLADPGAQTPDTIIATLEYVQNLIGDIRSNV